MRSSKSAILRALTVTMAKLTLGIKLLSAKSAKVSSEELYEMLFEDMLSLALATKIKLVSNLPFVKGILEPKQS